jgi:hypothetical protein
MAPRKAAATLKTAVAKGDHKASLEALRDRLAVEIERCEGSAVAALAKQLSDVLAKLAAMPNQREKSPVDELSRRRTTRRAKAAAPKQAAGGNKRRAGGGRARS